MNIKVKKQKPKKQTQQKTKCQSNDIKAIVVSQCQSH